MVDSCGATLDISWDGGLRIVPIGQLVPPDVPRILYLGKPPDRPGTRAVAVGSAMESALIDVLRIYADAHVPHAAQDSLARIAFDYTLPIAVKKDRLRLDGDGWRALEAAKLAGFLEKQRSRFFEDSD